MKNQPSKAPIDQPSFADVEAPSPRLSDWAIGLPGNPEETDLIVAYLALNHALSAKHLTRSVDRLQVGDTAYSATRTFDAEGKVVISIVRESGLNQSLAYRAERDALRNRVFALQSEADSLRQMRDEIERQARAAQRRSDLLQTDSAPVEEARQLIEQSEGLEAWIADYDRKIAAVQTALDEVSESLQLLEKSPVPTATDRFRFLVRACP